MDDELGRQSIALCNLCFAGFAAAKTPALLQELWPRRIVDRTVDSSATEQGTVGGVDIASTFSFVMSPRLIVILVCILLPSIFS